MTNWRASLIFVVFILVSVGCTKWFRKRERKPARFVLKLPLAEDYTVVASGLTQIILHRFPAANIRIADALSDDYVFAPVAEWLTKGDANAPLKLVLMLPHPDDRDAVLTYLKANELKIPFKVFIPAPIAETSAGRGESVFCHMKFERRDLFEHELCKEFYESLCGGEPRLATKPPKTPALSCRLVPLFNPVNADTESTKEIFLSGFPLPIKVKNDYPFDRPGEVDENLLVTLFGRN